MNCAVELDVCHYLNLTTTGNRH